PYDTWLWKGVYGCLSSGLVPRPVLPRMLLGAAGGAVRRRIDEPRLDGRRRRCFPDREELAPRRWSHEGRWGRGYGIGHRCARRPRPVELACTRPAGWFDGVERLEARPRHRLALPWRQPAMPAEARRADCYEQDEADQHPRVDAGPAKCARYDRQ